jgi:hypothetical protein
LTKSQQQSCSAKPSSFDPANDSGNAVAAIDVDFTNPRERQLAFTALLGCDSVTVNDLPYPLRLCVELLGYAGLSCPKTQDMTANQIKEAASVFFDDAMIAEATDILCGRPKNIYMDGELQDGSSS